MAGLSTIHSGRRVPASVVEIHHLILSLKTRESQERQFGLVHRKPEKKMSSHKERKECVVKPVALQSPSFSPFLTVPHRLNSFLLQERGTTEKIKE
jgi:hypothetical protein